MGFGGAPAAATPQSHKWVALADGVPDAQVANVVNACRAGVRYVGDHPNEENADGRGWQHLAEVHAGLANAARESSLKRGKPLVWSLGRIADYMQSEAAEAKRAAARRRVPPSEAKPSAAAGDSPAGKGGAK